MSVSFLDKDTFFVIMPLQTPAVDFKSNSQLQIFSFDKSIA